jgi:SAM-dependent methyltransferase
MYTHRGAKPLVHDPYEQGADGISRPPRSVAHRDDEYPSEGFDELLAIQRRHFWYRGRHRFILHFTRQVVARLSSRQRLLGIDLGGGCGGWISYLHQHEPTRFEQLALADSSVRALQLAAPVLPERVRRYQIDLLDLQWEDRWDVAFLLDVLEHLDDDVGALRQIRSALRPGGCLIVTTPALERFRTPIDDMSQHVRRYTRADMATRAAAAGLELVTSRYFMFFLSPLLLLSRWHIPDADDLTPAQGREYLRRSSEVPPAPLNTVLAGVFSLETPVGDWIPFPWGTSVLAVFRRV